MSAAEIRLDSLNLVVSDVPASRAFYSRLGLDFGNAHDPVWDNHHVSTGSVELPAAGAASAPLGVDLDSTSFVNHWDVGWPGGSGVVLGFRVETRQAVDDTVADLVTHGATVQQPPWDAFWGARYAVVSDPNGIAVGIMSPMDPAMRSENPDPA
jgi:catechol 2,3-dioxygenase-like lactoylglutathione lyase family enzyme